MTLVVSSQVCKMVTHKLKLPGTRVAETSLILVSTVKHDGASAVQQQLRTLGDSEKPVEMQLRAVRKYLEANPGEKHPPNPDAVCRWFFRVRIITELCCLTECLT